MGFHRYVELAAVLCALALGCGPSVDDMPDETSSEADSGTPPPLAGELYGRCDHGACDDPVAECVQCGGSSSCPHDAFCSLPCADVSQCPADPSGAPPVCHLGGCSIDCAEQACPFDMDCIEFGQPGIDAHPICMWREQ